MKKKLIFLLVVLILDVILFPQAIHLGYAWLQSGAAALELWAGQPFSLQPYRLTATEQPRLFVFLALQALPAWLLINSLWYYSGNGMKAVRPAAGLAPAGQGQHGTARWQTPQELRETADVWHYRGQPRKGGIILGFDRRKPRAYVESADAHTLIVGATRAGKSRRLVMPTIWQLAQAGESMILTDPKGELYERTAKYLEENDYNVVLLDFRKPGRGNRWNPLEAVIRAIELDDMPEAAKNAWTIANLFVYSQEGARKSEPIWNNGAESVIAGLVLAVAIEARSREQKNLTSVYRMLSVLGQPQMIGDREFVPLLEYISGLPHDHPAKDALATALLAPDKTRGSFFTTVTSLLRLFADPSLAYLTGGQDHDPKEIGINKTAVFLIIPDEDKTRHPLAALYVDQTYQKLVELANESGGRVPNRVNMLMDEFGNMPQIKDFDSKLTVSGGRGIRWHLIVQDYQQLDKVYKDAANTIKGNCHTLLYLLTLDVKTAEEISKKCGKITVQTISTGTSGKTFGMETTRSVNASLMGRDLLTLDEVLRWPSDASLVIRARQFPARLFLPDMSKLPCDRLFEPTPDSGRRFVSRVSVFIPGVTDEDEPEPRSQRQTQSQEAKASAHRNHSNLLDQFREEVAE